MSCQAGLCRSSEDGLSIASLNVDSEQALFTRLFRAMDAQCFNVAAISADERIFDGVRALRERGQDSARKEMKALRPGPCRKAAP